MNTNAIIFLLILVGFCNCSQRSNESENEQASSSDTIPDYCEYSHAYYQSGNLEKSREMFLQIPESTRQKKLKDVILGKRLFFVPDTFQVPGELRTESFLLVPLKAIHAEMDYAAVMSSVDHLTGVIGRRDWPGNLTLEEDRNALAGHEWEFENRTGFVYTVMNTSESEIFGCVYIYPSRMDDFDTEIVMWEKEKEFNRGMDEILFQKVDAWIRNEWPFEGIIYPGREINWGDFFEKLEKQDEQYL